MFLPDALSYLTHVTVIIISKPFRTIWYQFISYAVWTPKPQAPRYRVTLSGTHRLGFRFFRESNSKLLNAASQLTDINYNAPRTWESETIPPSAAKQTKNNITNGFFVQWDQAID